MGQLFATIRQLVEEEKYVVGEHASVRLEEPGIMEWQVVAALEDGVLLAERPEATPNPAVEVRESLPDGTELQGRLVAFASEWRRQTCNRSLLRQRLAMRIPGQRIRRTRLVQTEKYVVAVEVEMVVPVDDPSEPCYESETIQLLREIKEHAERGDTAWLTQKGKVYAAVEAA